MGLGGPVNRLTRTSTHYTHLDEEACLRVTTGYSQTEGCKLQKINVVESKYCYIVAWSETTLSIYIYIYGKIVIILTAGHFSIDAVCQLCTKTLTQNIFVCRIHSSLVPPWSGWTSRQDFFHLQAGVWELCISYMLRSAEKHPLHFCMQFTKAINSAILMFSLTLRWDVSCLPCVTVPGGRGPTLPNAGGPRLLKELYFTWMMKAYLLPQSSSGTTTQVTFAGTVNSWRTSSEASLNTTVTTYDNTRMTLENSSGIVGGSQVTFTTPPLLLETLLISSAEIFVSSSGSNASALNYRHKVQSK